MSKIYLHNPDNGAKIKNWYDGSNFWSLDVGEVAAFPKGAGEDLARTYGFLRKISLEDFEAELTKLDKTEPTKIKVASDGSLQPKSKEEIDAEKEVLETKKEEVKKLSKKIKEAKDAEPAKPHYYELPRGALINECNKRGIEVKGLNTKGVHVTKDQLINYLENDDAQK